MDEAETTLGEYIRRQREMHELSLRQMAEMAGISNPYLSQIEHGLREPSEKVLDAIARSLQLPAESLYAQSGHSRPAADDEDEPAVVAAIQSDPRLTARQRQAMLEVYASFTGRRRPRRES